MLDTYRYKVDFSGVEDYWDIHDIIKESLDFPDYYGGNTDALWDCLTDMLGDPSHIELVGFEKVKDRYKNEWEGILRMMKKAKHAYGGKYANTFVVVLIHEDGTREEIL